VCGFAGFGPEYDKMIDSKFADMKNTGGRWAADHRGQLLHGSSIRRRGPSDIAGTAMGSPQTDINKSWASRLGRAASRAAG